MTQHLSASSALDEELARAELYGLLARLWYAAPDARLLEAFRTTAAAAPAAAPAEAPAAGVFLEEPWRQLVAAARDTSVAAMSDEYDALFGGIGKPEIFLFGSHYLSGFLNDKPLVKLRDDLARLGLARSETTHETEDHIAYLFEAMRYLIADDDVGVANLTEQQAIFSKHIQPFLPALCEAVSRHPRARFYAALAVFTRAFGEVEAQAFDMLS